MSLKPRTLSLKRPELVINKLLINGDWKAGAKTFPVLDPATGAEIADVVDGTREDTTAAIKAASTAFNDFKTTTARQRSDLLRKWGALVRENSSDLATLISAENGKPLTEATGEILSCAQTFEWFSELAPHYNGATIPSQVPNVRISSFRQPVGVCGIVTPWNFPSLMLARKVGAAIGSGCTVVVKPAEDTPLSALALLYLGQEAGVPDGVLNLITTKSHTVDVGEELTTNKDVRKITFTGSTGVGKLLMKQAASSVKKVSFELGGNAPFIVFDDADLAKVIPNAIASKFRGSGQTCVCANRFFVQSGIYDRFVAEFTRAVEALKPGHGLDEGTTQGPLINEKSLEKVKEHVADATGKGGRLTTGGEPRTDLGPWFYAPTVVADLDPHTAKVFSEETFGPLAAVAKFTSEEEVIALANSNEAGLGGYFFSNDINRCIRVSEALEVGMVGINTGLITEVALPFGGVKESGFGRENSNYGFEDYTVVKSTVTNIA